MQKGPWYEGLLDPQEELKAFVAELQPTITKTFRTFARHAAQGVQAEFDPFEATAQAWVEGHSFGLIQDLFDQTFATTKQALQKTMADGWQAGESVNQLAGRIRSVFDQATRHRSYLIARTETTTAANAATLAVWQQAKVPYKQWLTGRDERVCPVCGALDGEVVPLDEAFSLGMQGPPAHPGCRCSLRSCEDPSGVPDFDTLDEATAWAQKRYPHITWEFDGADVEAVTPTLRQFQKLARDYPEVARGIKYIGTYGGDLSQFPAREYAHANRRTRAIGLNPSFYGNTNHFLRRLQENAQTKFHPLGSGCMESILTHEFGHHMLWWLLDNNGAVLRYVSHRTGMGLIDATTSMWLGTHKPTLALSEYAKYNSAEAFAEGLLALYHSPPSVQRLAYVKRLKTLLEVMWDRATWVPHNEVKWLYELAGTPQHAQAQLLIEQLDAKLELWKEAPKR